MTETLRSGILNGYQYSVWSAECKTYMDPCEDTDFKFATWHRRYALGTDNFVSTKPSPEEWKKENPGIHFSVWLYDHSGLALSLGPFSCPWDSGWLGLLTFPDSVAAEYLSVAETTMRKGRPRYKKRMEYWAEIFIREKNQYLAGSAYAGSIKKDGVEVADFGPALYGGPDELVREIEASMDFLLSRSQSVGS